MTAALAAALDAALIVTLAWDLRHARERARQGAAGARVRVATG